RGVEHPGRLLLLAELDGVVVGSGMADKSDLTGRASVAPRVIPEYRGRGVGSLLLRALASFATDRGHALASASIDDERHLGFARRHGFAESDREVEQVRAIGVEPRPDV